MYAYISVPTEGSQVHIDSFIRAAQELGHTLHVLGTPEAAFLGGKEAWSRARRIRVRLHWYWQNIRHLARTVRVARRIKPDAILFRFDPLHRFALAIVGLSFIYPVILEINGVRSIENHQGRPRVSDWLDRLLISRSKRAFVVSDRLKQHLVSQYRVDERKIAVIENGVDPAKFSPKVSGQAVRAEFGLQQRFVVGFVGSFRPWHGIGGLLTLAGRALEEIPDIAFLIVGDGTDRPAYEQRARQLGIDGLVTFAGQVDHARIPQFLAAADVLMYPMPAASFDRGFYGSALKLFEYMAMGKPVITSPLGQNVKLIDDGVSGLLISAEDYDGLTRALIRLRASPEVRAALGAAARSTVVSRYTWRANAEKVLALCSGMG